MTRAHRNRMHHLGDLMLDAAEKAMPVQSAPSETKRNGQPMEGGESCQNPKCPYYDKNCEQNCNGALDEIESPMAEVCTKWMKPEPVQPTPSEEDAHDFAQWFEIRDESHGFEGPMMELVRDEIEAQLGEWLVEHDAALRAQFSERTREGCAEKIGLHYKHCLSNIQQFVYDNGEAPLSSLQPMLDEQRKTTLALFVEIHAALDGKEKQ